MSIHRFIKRAISCFLSGVIALSLIGCGKKDNETPEITAVADSYVYVPEYITLTEEENTYVGDMFKLGNKLYYMLSKSDEEEQETKESICYIDLNNPGSGPQLYAELNSKEEAKGLCSSNVKRLVTHDGSIIQIDRTYPISKDGFNEQNVSYYMHKTDKDSKEIFTIDISSYIKENSFIQYMIEDNDGNLYLSNGCSCVWVFNPNGEHMMDIKLEPYEKDGGFIHSFGIIQDGRVAYIDYANNGMVLKVYNETKQDFSDIYENIPVDCFNTYITSGAEKGILLCGKKCLYEYDPLTQESKEITVWLDESLNGDYVSRAYALENGDIAIYYNDWYLNESTVVLLKKTLASEVKQKENITLGCMNISQDMQSAVLNFNKNSEHYKIEIKDYISSANLGEVTEDYDTVSKKLLLDIVTGKGPDLFVASDVDIDLFARKGVIEDLNPYLDNSQVINRADLIEPVLNAYTANGILCSIPATFSVHTMTGRTSEVGDQFGWTLDEMIAYAEKNPDEELLSQASNTSILDYCIMFDMDTYVNWETGFCSFNTDQFKKVLKLARRYPDEGSIQYDISIATSLRTHKALLYITGLYAPIDWQVTEKMFDEPITPIGFPCNDSSGALVNGNAGVCINASSQNKEAAWSFIEYLLSNTDESCAFLWGFSTKKSVFEDEMEKAMIPEYMKDENGDLILDEDGNPKEIVKGYGWGEDTMEIYSVRQEEADTIRQIINRINGSMNYNMQLMSIIDEEAAAYFKGQKTVDEVMEIIQSRVQVYMNEMSK